MKSKTYKELFPCNIRGDLMTTETIILGVNVALLLAILYSLRRIYVLEYKMIALDLKIEKLLEHSKKRR